MSSNYDEELLERYNAWATEKKRTRDDLTPAQFLVEKAQNEALSRLIKVSEYLDGLSGQNDFRVTAIRKIING